MPIDVLVGEVESLQQAATRLRVNADRCEVQLEQIQDRQKRMLEISIAMDKKKEEGGFEGKERVYLKEKIDGTQKSELGEAMKSLEEQQQTFRDVAAKMTRRFEVYRDQGVERFLRPLLETVAQYDKTFENLVLSTENGEEILAKIENLSRNFKGAMMPPHFESRSQQTKGRNLRHINPSSAPVESKETLLRLMQLAMIAYEPLMELAKSTCKAACQDLQNDSSESSENSERDEDRTPTQLHPRGRHACVLTPPHSRLACCTAVWTPLSA